MEQRYFVGVDGGGTKTALVAITFDGQEVATALCGPLNYNFIGLDAAIENLGDGIAALGLPVESIAAIGIGDPSIDDESESPAAKEFANRATNLFGVPVYVRSDAYMTLFALTGGQKAGVLIISGTGSMAIGEDDAGNISVTGGWGRLTGDEGSGYYIGLEGIRAALRAADGVAAKTALTSAALAHFGADKPRELIPVFYGETEPDVAGFSRCVAECANDGDKVAENILLDAAAHLVRYASVLVENCHADVLGVWGSVLCKNKTVRQAFENGVREKFPNITICEPRMSAELAAALYAAKQQKERDAK
jgi:N-acetylglucosamine kinase-like BadF-type ATPase